MRLWASSMAQQLGTPQVLLSFSKTLCYNIPHGRPLVLHQAPDPGGRQDCGGVEVVHGDESAKEFTYHTDAEYLGQVLVEEKLVKGESSQFGLYITTVDGETAQESENQWWRVTQDGEMVNTGVDTTPVQDGDHFELTLSTY